MFRRRHKPTLAWRLRNAVWPDAGWSRASKYVVCRVRRLPGSPRQAALGFACGAFISFTPFFGVHYLLSVIAAWSLRGSIVGALFGANLGFLYPFVLLWAYRLGAWMLGTATVPLPDHPSLVGVLRDLWTLFLPILVGSIPFGLSIATLSFTVVYWAVRAYRRLRERRTSPRAAAAFRG